MRWKIIIALIICLGSIFLFIIAPRLGIKMENILPSFMKSKVLLAGEDLTGSSSNLSNQLFSNTASGATIRVNASQFKLSKWNDESYLSLNLPTSTSTATIGNTVHLNNSVFESILYMKNPNLFEFEAKLNRRLFTNSISFTIDLKDLECYYNGRLDDEEKDYIHCNATNCDFKNGNGAYRPEKYVGSYACYHPTKTGNQYMTGKAFNIERPWVNSSGNFAWCNQTLIETITPGRYTYTLTCPLEYLTAGAVIGPGFGVSSIGATSRFTTDNSRFHMANMTETGTITTISGYGYTLNAGDNYALAIYNSTSDADGYPPTNLITNTSDDDAPTSAQWITKTATSVSITNPTSRGYFIGAVGTGRWYYYTDTGGTTAGKADVFPFDDPFGTSTFSTSYKISFYANYTTTIPVVINVAPTTNQNFYDTNYVNFSCNVSDTVNNITSVTLNIYNATGVYNSTANTTSLFDPTNVTYYFNNFYIPFGANPLYNYTCTAINNISQSVESSKTNFYVISTNRFIPPTPLSNTTYNDWIYLNMSINTTCGTGVNELKAEFDGVNHSIVSGGPLNPPGYYNYNATGLTGGNHTYQIWCNAQNYAPNWTVVENPTSLVSTINSPTNDYFQNNFTGIINCSGYAPSGVTNISLFADFNNVKYEYLLVNSTGFDGTQTNVSYVFKNTIGTINDTYNYYCRVQSLGNNYANSSINTIKIGKAIVYIVQAVDTESYSRESTDNQFNMSLDLRAYNISNFANYSWEGNVTLPTNGLTIQLFDPNWRNLYNDSTNEQVKFTWYLMTHEAHCHATNQFQNPPGCNVIADIMYGNNTKYFNYNGIWESEIDKNGDDYGWHNHQAYWNGTTETTPNSWWLGALSSDFFFNGTNLFFNNTLNESDYLRAEKLVSLFAYSNALPWSSFRAGWLQTGEGDSHTNYMNFLSNNTALDFSDLPASTGNFWTPERFEDTQNRLIGFRCSGGVPTNAQMNNSFAYAQNGTRVVVCAYMHNYAGATIKSDTSGLNALAKSASTNYSVNFVYATALEAAQAYYRITDTTPPLITTSIDGNYLYADVNEVLYMPPAVSVLINNGTTTNYLLEYMEKVNDTRYRFDKSKYNNNGVGYRVRATDKYFNVNTSSYVESNINLVYPTSINPKSVTYPQNITINFTASYAGTTLTTGVTVLQINITNSTDSFSCDLKGSASYVAPNWMQNCSVPNLPLGASYNLYIQANLTNYNLVLTDTENNAVSYGVADTCSPPNPLTANYVFECADYCIIGALDAGGYNILINGTGNFTATGKITNYKRFTMKGTSPTNKCYIYMRKV